MSEREYIVKHTGTSLDDMVVLCDETKLVLVDEDAQEGVCECLEVIKFIDTDEDLESKGVFIQKSHLVPIFKTNENTNPAGKYLKSYSYETASHKLNLVDLENTLQVSVVASRAPGRSHLFQEGNDTVLHSSYKHKDNLLTIKKLFEYFVDEVIDIEELVTQIELLD